MTTQDDAPPVAGQPETGRAALPPFNRGAVEKMLARLQQAIQERGLTSEEEIQAYLHELMADEAPLFPIGPLTPLDQAQDLIYDAWEEEDESRRVQLARRALKISPDCADAYSLLAEAADTLEKSRDLYQKGVQAGERALGESFVELEGMFWGMLETRPYMRARFGLAHSLWLLGERRQAVAHLQEMLRLNPNDNQGLRYVLMNWLLERGEDQALGELLDRYPSDIAADWWYARALWLYRTQGASAEATRTLREAITRNAFVPLYLLGRKPLPDYLPDRVGIGTEDEAASYAAEALHAWRASDGALTWLAQQLAAPSRRGRRNKT